MKRSGSRHVTLSIVVIVVVLGLAAGAYALVPSTDQHKGGDPGAALLSAVRGDVTALLPSGSTIVREWDHDSHWMNAGGCDGSVGWSQATYGVLFRTGVSASALASRIHQQLSASGWRASPASKWIWFKGAGDSNIQLARDWRNAGAHSWRLQGWLDPTGQRQRQC
jgi:hypothetical protein